MPSPSQSQLHLTTLRQIELLETLLLTAQYREVGQQYAESKEKQREAHKRMLALKAKNEPAHKLEKYVSDFRLPFRLTDMSENWRKRRPRLRRGERGRRRS